MSADDRGSVCNLSDDYLFRRKDASSHLFWHGRTVGGEDVDDFAPYPSVTPPFGNLVAAPVDVTEYIDKSCLYLDARGLAGMFRDGDRLVFVDARYSGRHYSSHGA